MRDLLPEEQFYWQKVEKSVNSLASVYGFEKIDLPVLEDISLFAKTKKKHVDELEKEMCVLRVKEGRKLTLRSEITSSCIRAYFDNGFHKKRHPVKLFSLGPVFHYEKSKEKGFHQTYQASFDAVGSKDPIMYAHLMQVCFAVLKKGLGLKNVIIHINSLGCKKCGSSYKKSLMNFLKKREGDLCQSCRRTLYSDPLSIFNCDNLKCIEIFQESPQMVEYLCPGCKSNFKSVLEYLDELELPYLLDSNLLQDMGYYSKTIFSVFSDYEGQDQENYFKIAEGGRYDNLVKSIGGKENPGIGFNLRLDEIVGLMKNKRAKISFRKRPLVFIIQIGALGRKKSLNFFEFLSKSNL